MAPPSREGRTRTLSSSLNAISGSLSKQARLLPRKFSFPDLLLYRSPRAVDAHDEERIFDADMEKQPRRRLSRRTSGGIAARWGKTFGKSSASVARGHQEDDMRDSSVTGSGSLDKGKARASFVESLNDDAPLNTQGEEGSSNLATSSTIVPDPFPLSETFNRWIPGVGPTYRAIYSLHNPNGPRHYKNMHLVPPANLIGAENSTLSPPPGVSSLIEAAFAPSHSRSASTSPLPTPTSSQTHVGIGVPGRRTRKISQTTPHDNVDMWDASDPWGTQWHHQSPYDTIGLTGPGPDPQTMSGASRTSSSGAVKGRMAAPSPLSQSTSAIHLPMDTPSSAPASAPRSWSKGQPSGFKRFLPGSGSNEDNEGAATPVDSRPDSPLDRSSPDRLDVPDVGGTGTAPRRKLSKKRTAPGSGPPPVERPLRRFASRSMSHLPMEGATGPEEKKRGGIFGVLSKKLSVLKRPIGDFRNPSSPDKDWWLRHRQNSIIRSKHGQNPSTISVPVQPSNTQPAYASNGHTNNSTDSLSLLEAPFTMGRLTIANPDLSGSEPPSPANAAFPSRITSRASGGEWAHPSPPVPSKSPLPLPRDDHKPIMFPVPDAQGNLLPDSTVASAKARPDPLQLTPFSPFQVTLSPGKLASPALAPPPLPEKPSKRQSQLSQAPIFIDPEPQPEPVSETVSPTNTDASLPVEQAALMTEIQSILSTSSGKLDLANIPLSRIPTLPVAPSLFAMIPQLSSGRLSIDTHTSSTSMAANPPTPTGKSPDVPPLPSADAPPIPPRSADRPSPTKEQPSHSNIPATKPDNSAPEASTHRSRSGAEHSHSSSSADRHAEKSESHEKTSRSKSKADLAERKAILSSSSDSRSRREASEHHHHHKSSRHDASEIRHRREAAETTSRHGTPESRKEMVDPAKMHDLERRPRRPSMDNLRSRQEATEARSSKYETGERSSKYETGDARSSKYRSDSKREVRHDSSSSESRTRRDASDAKARYEDSKGHSSSRKDRDVTMERFKLIRTGSDKVQMLVNDVTKVGDDYWSVVEAPSSSKRKDSKDRGKVRDRQKEREREKEREKEKAREKERRSDRERDRDGSRDRDRTREKEHRRDRERSDSDRDKRDVRRDESVRHRRDTEPTREERERSTVTRTAVESTTEHRKSSRNPDEKEYGSERRRHEDRHTKQSSGAHDSSDRRRRTKETSDTLAVPPQMLRRATVRRPVSDVVPEASDFASLSAREAWEAERLWKAKSAAYDDASGYPSMRYDYSRYSDVSNMSATAGSFYSLDSMLGSSHTSYMVQSPFQSQGSAHAHSGYYVPVYQGSPYAAPGSQGTPGPYDYSNSFRSYSDAIAFPSMDGPESNDALSNPLPEPPRQSMYSLGSVGLSSNRTHSVVDPDPSTPEYWQRYAGIPTH